MTKKELLITLLQKLQPHRDVADGFLVIVERSDDETLIDQLLDLIYQALKKLQKENWNVHLQQSLSVLEKIKAQETKEHFSDDDLEDLLDTLDK